MKCFVFFLFLFCLPALVSAQTVVKIKLDGTINPASADFIQRSIESANDVKAECLVIQLNTPGGLLTSTRNIVSSLLESPIPVVVFVSPAGAHAGSAGVFVTLAANIAAMAPGTNIGAAHPVELQGQMDSVMNEKATNDALAFIRTIAEKRNRNLEWAQDAVRNSIAITETEALNQHVVDLIAANISDLLDSINGRKVTVNGLTQILHTKNAKVEEYKMTAMDNFLNIISDPNLSYILFLLGLYGLLFELYNPGSILPGIVGVISLVFAFYSMQALPVNYAGLALIIFAVILFLLELKLATHGVLALGGIVSLTLGSLMLFHAGSSLEYVNVSKTVIISAVAVSALFFLVIIGLGLKAQRAKPVTGTAGMVGETGTVLEALNPSGIVFVHGERWKAETAGEAIEEGTKVLVISIKDMKLKVERLNS